MAATGLENLFAHEPELPNVQKTKLPDNVSSWAETITTLVRENFPDVSKMPLEVEFKKKDDQEGTAIGSVHVINTDVNKSVYLPIIIDKFQLHPMDIWMEKKTQAVHPLTKDTFKELFFSPNFAEGLDARPADSMGNYFNDPSMWTTTYPPLQGRYSYASAGYNLLDVIADTMTQDDLEAFRAELKASPMLLQKFAKHGHSEIISKLAAKKGAVNTMDYGASAKKLIPTSYIQVKREGQDKYSLLSMADGMFDLATSVKMDHRHCHDFLSKIVGKPQDFMTEVDENGEKVAILKPAPKEGVWLYDTEEQKAVPANEFNCYWVKNKNGLMLEALVIPDIVNFEGKRIKGKAVLSRTHSCFQDNVAGIPYPQSEAAEKILKPSAIRTGQTGLFVYIGKNGKAIATMPVTIRAIEGEWDQILAVTDLNGKKFRVRQSWGKAFKKSSLVGDGAVKDLGDRKETTNVTLESLGFAEIDPDYFIIPDHMMWIPMEPMTEVTHTPAEWLEKTAMLKMSMDPVKVRYTGIVYDFSGGGLPHLEANEDQARALLVNLGADLDKVAHILKKAKHVGRATVHGTQKLDSSQDVVEKMKSQIAKIAVACKKMKKKLVKEAAEIGGTEIEDKQTVDMLLALNFLNPENLSKFVAYVPVFEKCADYLAELTLASRLGLKQVNSATTANCMGKLMDILDDLKRIGASMKKPTTKAV